MSLPETIASYSFLPWLRQGIANNITAADGNEAVKLRVSIPIQLKLGGNRTNGSAIAEQILNKTIHLYGPGDIISIDSKAIIKSEPRNWITNFEPNYLPYVDFYYEDFPWRYTPSASINADRLRPWITLVVLKENEFENGVGVKDKPLPFFKLKEGIKTADIFPKPAELWAWAHVHVNTDLTGEAAPNAANPTAITAGIKEIIEKNPDAAYSRIICPRKLENNESYYAFVIPSFESGRLAGLGQEIKNDLVATESAWDNESKVEFPYYHRWYFRTGSVGDFEYLVNLLQPKPADKSVGVRDIDVQNPGSNLPPINDLALKGVLKLGGALRVPIKSLKNEEDKSEAKSFDKWDENPEYPHPFTKAMAKRINLADDYSSNGDIIQVNEKAGILLQNESVDADIESVYPDIKSVDPDPVITSPLYGQWQALQKRLLFDRDDKKLPNNKNWIHELNLDPRFRTAAGLGTKVVQQGQEEFMLSAWQQVGEVIEANNKIRFAQVAKEVSDRLYIKHLKNLTPDKQFTFTAPVYKRVIYKSLTLQTQVEQSRIPAAVSSGVFRKIVRPGSAVMKKLTFSDKKTVNNIASRINIDEDNKDKVIVAPSRIDPEGAITLTEIANQFKPKGLPPAIERWLRELKAFKYIPFILVAILILIILIFFISPLGLTLLGFGSAGLLWTGKKLLQWDKELKLFDTISQTSQTPDSIAVLSNSPDFVISQPGSGFSPSEGSTDSNESIRFKEALKGAYELIDTKFTEPVKMKLEFQDVIDQTLKSIDPNITIPKRTLDRIKFPAHIKNIFKPEFTPVMVYPVIDLPMYKPLADISAELFLPNINNIEQNSITLLENNQKFIESYMVGINHEMSRELLWREYPTDQRGTYFRQFWDVNSVLSEEPVPADIKEKLRDIPPIHIWNMTSESKMFPAIADSPLKNELGTHNQRAEVSGKTQIVLVIRGELLKKYPTAVVYAQKAVWGKTLEGVEDKNLERELIELSDEEINILPQSKFQTPLFEAKIDPDIYFFGFDLDDEEVRGNEVNPGWFFVLKERPGEPRFGLDIDKAKTETGQERIINWNNLSWKDIETENGKCIELVKNSVGSNLSISFNTYDEGLDQENKVYPDDAQAQWNDQITSAELAYILYQVPVMVAVHGSRMLPEKEE